jgi:hypothetical protein
MKLLLCVVASFLIAACVATEGSLEKAELGPHIISFEAFKAKFNKVYQTERERRLREVVFQKNLRLIENMNKKEGRLCGCFCAQIISYFIYMLATYFRRYCLFICLFDIFILFL